MVTAEGQAKIMDFGIARLNLTHLTLPGHALGTPAYISPEQLNGDPVDGRADIFSLSVILYNMVTGYRPFQGNSVITVCFKVANREPLAPTLLDQNLPGELDAVIARAIAKNPVDRYQRGMELALDLGELLERRTPSIQSKMHARNVNAPTTSAPTPVVSEVDLAFARSSLSRVVNSRKIVVVCACVTALGLLSSYRPLPRAHPATVSSTPAIPISTPNSTDATPAIAPAPVGAVASHSSTLDIEVNHHFTDGKISIWVDGALKYSHSLHGETKKHLLLFHGAQGRESRKLSIPAGQHHINVRAQAHSDAVDQRKELSGAFAPGSQKILLISFDGPHKDMRVALK